MMPTPGLPVKKAHTPTPGDPPPKKRRAVIVDAVGTARTVHGGEGQPFDLDAAFSAGAALVFGPHPIGTAGSLFLIVQEA
ncbi:hypothetical protein [Limnoglobus roseus]|nr:hypothetical protein [Limnoglobus roseus]